MRVSSPTKWPGSGRVTPLNWAVWQPAVTRVSVSIQGTFSLAVRLVGCQNCFNPSGRQD
ncbi:unnamed protein product [Protopolystoma xenopodis]|uniref:Uncharacterized protein n=1 Tax=Protopolystoma xenopodis TaxID=117903 RepID=A0A448XP54_9PLAT|nr:unnamed protein product [Protopolystoma xenopodis]